MKTFEQSLADLGLKDPSCYSYIGPGWIPLFEATVAKLRAAGYTGGFAQVKEKFCGLRIYLENEDGLPSDAVCKILTDAENESFGLCENCGGPREDTAPRMGAPLCDTCFAESRKVKP